MMGGREQKSERIYQHFYKALPSCFININCFTLFLFSLFFYVIALNNNLYKDIIEISKPISSHLIKVQFESNPSEEALQKIQFNSSLLLFITRRETSSLSDVIFSCTVVEKSMKLLWNVNSADSCALTSDANMTNEKKGCIDTNISFGKLFRLS